MAVNLGRHSGMHLRSAIADLRPQARNPYSPRGLWIPGSLVSLAPRNDGILFARPARHPSLLRLAGVLDGLKSLELDVVEFAVDLLDLADVDVLHDVAGLRVDRDRPPRAFPFHALHGLDQRIAVGVAAGLFQRLIDQMNAVIAAHRHEAGARRERLLVGG